MTDQLFIRLGGQIRGPYSVNDLRELTKRGRFSKSHEISTDRRTWDSASTRPDLFLPLSGPTSNIQHQPTPDSGERQQLEANVNPASPGKLPSHGTDQATIIAEAQLQPGNSPSSAGSTKSVTETAPPPPLSVPAIWVAITGSMGFLLLLVCTAMIVLRLCASAFIVAQNTGLITIMIVDTILGCAALVLGKVAVRMFHERTGTTNERNLIVIGLSCGFTVLILIALYVAVLMVSVLR